MELAKEDYVLLARWRRLPLTDPALWRMRAAALEALLDPATEAEQALLAAHRARRTRLFPPHLSAERLSGMAKRLGLSKSAGETRGGTIDKLIHACERGGSPPLPPDPDQRSVIDRWDEPFTIVSAGPGSGKTTTICDFVQRVSRERADARILVLAFNRCARDTLSDRLRTRLLPPVAKQQVLKSDWAGCAVLTFDELGGQLNGSAAATQADVYGEAPGADEAPGDVVRGGYRVALERASGRLAGTEVAYDWLVVDEAQDLNSTHARIVDALRLRAAHTLIAGDPRQEVYSGASWFSGQWARAPAAHTAVLRYNHRSAPEIVDLVNRFSRAHFPSLHHDQIATRREKGRVEWNCGRSIGAILAERAPGEAYAIAPVSVHKFRLGAVALEARQDVYGARPGAYAVVLDDSRETQPEGAYLIGTARKLKGTERPRVVVFGTNAPYTRFSVPLESLLKLFFVAISRARDELFIVAEAAGVLGPLAPFAPPHLVARPPSRREAGYARFISVTDFVKLEAFAPAAREAPGVAGAVGARGLMGDADFVGVYVETLVAIASGLGRSLGKVDVRAEDNRNGIFRGIRFIGDRFLYTCARELVADVREMLERAGRSGNPAYAYAAARFSAECGKLWTVSGRLLEAPPTQQEIAPFAARLLALVGAGGEYQLACELPIGLHRSSKVAGAIRGATDFCSRRGVVELKHVGALSDAHRRQAAVYAALLEQRETLLVNTASGAAELVGAADRNLLTDLGRAALALQWARAVAARAVFRTRPPADLVPTCCIAIDIEEVARGALTEIGAVAFGAEGELFSTFHVVAAGVQAGAPPAGGPPAARICAELTGLAVVDPVALAAAQPGMLAALRAWVEHVSARRSFLHWGGHDALRLGLEPDGAAFDVLQVYRAWLDLAGLKRETALSLSDAAAHMLGPDWPFEPHRAFEDAVATAAVFLAMTDFGGVV